MKDIEEISHKIKTRKDQLGQLYGKFSENIALWNGKEQIFDSHKAAVNITGTELVSKALQVQASLVRARLDIRVRPPDRTPNPSANEQANQEELMYYYGYDQADHKLGLLGEAELLPSLAWQNVILGMMAVRVLVYGSGERIIWDFLPMNPQNLVFSFGADGLSWFSYETFRSKESLKEQYGVDIEKRSGKSISVTDYWDNKHNVRFLTESKERLGKIWKHPFGETPAIIHFVGNSPRVIGETEDASSQTWGESVFDHSKVAFRKLNQLRSIAATHARQLAQMPLDYTYPEGSEPHLEEDDLHYYAGALYKHPETEKLTGIKTADIPPSLVSSINELRAALEDVTYAELHPDRPAHSGSALRILGQGRSDFLGPRFLALDRVYTRICHMVKRQIIKQGLEIPVRTVVEDNYKVYNIIPALLDNDFYVDAQFIREDAYDEVEALQRAQMLQSQRLMSREDILDRVMREPDPQGQISKMDIEDVENSVPELKVKRAIKLYADRGMFEEVGLAKELLATMELERKMKVKQMFQADMQGRGTQQPAITGGNI